MLQGRGWGGQKKVHQMLGAGEEISLEKALQQSGHEGVKDLSENEREIERERERERETEKRKRE